MRLQGRVLDEADLKQIRELRKEHPEWSRQQLSIYLAQSWQWRNGVGQLKDMAARTLLLKLHARGLIDLPAPRSCNGNSNRRARAPVSVQPELLSTEPPWIDCTLDSIEPVSLQLVESLEQRRRVSQLLERYHYRGYSGAVGENVQYLASDAQRRELAVMVFGAAAWKVAARDQFIGWSVEQRRTHLKLLTNQQRFLILPWVRVRHLASHLLAQATRRLCADWQRRYGHPVWLAETFVEQERFAGTAYKAAGWIEVGKTTGRTRQDAKRTIQTPIKTVWIRPLDGRFRERLTSG